MLWSPLRNYLVKVFIVALEEIFLIYNLILPAFMGAIKESGIFILWAVMGI